MSARSPRSRRPAAPPIGLRGRAPPRLALTPDALELVAGRFRALGDASRLRLLSALMEGERSVRELEEATGLGQANVSRHLAVLRREGLVDRRADGNRALYRIVDPTVERLCNLVCGSLAERAAGSLEALGEPRRPRGRRVRAR